MKQVVRGRCYGPAAPPHPCGFGKKVEPLFPTRDAAATLGASQQDLANRAAKSSLEVRHEAARAIREDCALERRHVRRVVHRGSGRDARASGDEWHWKLESL